MEKRVGNIVATVTLVIGLAFTIVSVVFIRSAVDSAAKEVERFSELLSSSLVYEIGHVDSGDGKALQEALSTFGFDQHIEISALDVDGAVLATTSRDLQVGTPIQKTLPAPIQTLFDGLGRDGNAQPMAWSGLDGLMPRNQALYLFRYSPDAQCYLLICNHGQGTFETMRQQVATLALILIIVMFTLLFLLMYIVRTYRRRLIEAATTDELTGLANRKAFASAYGEAKTQEKLGSASLALIDVDLFKSINDTFGHAAGDEALAAVASCVREAAGSDGICGRWGGDEFICVRKGDEPTCTAAFEDMGARVRSLVLESGAQVSVSVGVCRITSEMELEGVVERADDALYVTKEHGRGFVSVYEEGVTPHMVKDGKGVPAQVRPEGQVRKAQNGATREERAIGQLQSGRKRISELVLQSLLQAVDKMVPFVAAGGIFIAVAFLVDGAVVDLESLSVAERADFGSITPVAKGLKEIGSAAFNFMLPIFAAFFAAGLGGQEAFMAGFAGGYLASMGNSGFVGAIMAGVISAVVCNLMRNYVSETKGHLHHIAPILLYPLFSLAIMYLIMHFLVEPVASSLEMALSTILHDLKDGNRTVLGAILGAMMASDMGGFINKCAYHFGCDGIGLGDTDLMAAVMVGGMVPPLGIALSMLFFPAHFMKGERDHELTTAIMGLAFITEGAIPFAITDFFRVIVSCIVGSSVAGGLSVTFGCTLMAPHGGIFVVPVVGNASFYLLSLLIGSVVTAVVLGLLKPVVDTAEDKLD